MAGKKDSLRYAIGRANLTGSFKTQHNHKQEAHRFVDALRSLGNGVQKWGNVSNKHVAQAVEHWTAEGLSVATIKNYLSGVRALCTAYGNDRIEPLNESFGVSNRVYVNNENKAVPEDVFTQAVQALRDSGDSKKARVALMLEYQRHLGLRLEESMKFNPLRDDVGLMVYISKGTKGGRPRWLSQMDGDKWDILQKGRKSDFYRWTTDSIIPKEMNDRAWVSYVYRTVRSVGLTREAGYTMHGLRHAYAHERFEQMTGFAPPVNFDSLADYQENALLRNGPDFKYAQDRARWFISEELGHGRIEIVSQYLGSFGT